MKPWHLALFAALLCLSSVAARPTAAASVIYLSPRPATDGSSALTSIALRTDEPLSETSVRAERFVVSGARSGSHTGRAVLARDGVTALFYPDRPFVPGETVSVGIAGLRTNSGASVASTAFAFEVSPKALADYGRPSPDGMERETAPVAEALASQPLQAGALAATTSFKTVQEELPYWHVLTSTSQAAPGDIFLAPFSIPPYPNPTPALLILDPKGELVYFQRLPADGRGLDFKLQPNGMLSYFTLEADGFVLMDDTYTTRRIIKAGNGYTADAHDLQILPNGNALLMIYASRKMDLTAVGGLSDATVIDLIIQEIDPDGNVVFEWNSKDYFAVSDTYAPIANQGTVDYVHGNAVALDTDGNLLISSRHLAEITKINRQTGAIIWRLGGKNNEFNFLNSDPFYYQHDIRRLSNGHITLFNNRTDLTPVYSRAEEYDVDENNKTISLVWSHRSAIQAYSFAMGSAQRLPNGNTAIGWGAGLPAYTEVTAADDVAFELALEAPMISYRAFRFPWEGHPTTRPVLVAQLEGNETAVYISWNGATQVASWRVDAGTRSTPLTEVAAQGRTGFETRIAIDGLQANTCYFRATALDASGAVIGQSSIIYGQGPGCPSAEPSYLYLPALTQN